MNYHNSRCILNTCAKLAWFEGKGQQKKVDFFLCVFVGGCGGGVLAELYLKEPFSFEKWLIYPFSICGSQWMSFVNRIGFFFFFFLFSSIYFLAKKPILVEISKNMFALYVSLLFASNRKIFIRKWKERIKKLKKINDPSKYSLNY